ncbi:hypothetical protein GCM10020367_07950 [Streptomyces sannanensis]|uniref:Peptidase M20 dimerisation domain-containing protein n=1 Tax=Streptomyces sannanensis TaxID=285536 RepID=A0ABP6S5P9_9ACTN
MVGQPAEETLSGAEAMLRDGRYQRLGRPDSVLAQHAAPLPSGTVAHATEQAPMTAASAVLDVKLHGQSGHAATPHLAVDPVVTAAAVVTRLQNIVARETDDAVVLETNERARHAWAAGGCHREDHWRRGVKPLAE